MSIVCSSKKCTLLYERKRGLCCGKRMRRGEVLIGRKWWHFFIIKLFRCSALLLVQVMASKYLDGGNREGMKKTLCASKAEQVFVKGEEKIRKGLFLRHAGRDRDAAPSTSAAAFNFKKRALSVALAGALLLGTAGIAAGCDNFTDIIDPSIGNIDPETGYSQILTEIINSEYYNDISYRYINQDAEQDEYAPVPSGYLWDKFGIDIAQLYENEMGYDSDIYVKENDKNHVYVASRISVNGALYPYYICATLKYEISYREFEELEFLFIHKAIQSSYYIQELSKQRQPVEEYAIKVTQNTVDEFSRRFNRSDVYTLNVFGNKSVTIDWLDASVANQTIYVAVRDANSHFVGFRTTGVIRYMELAPSIIDQVSTLDSDSTIFNGPKSANATDFEKYVNSAEETICFVPSRNNNSYAIADIESSLIFKKE